MDAPPGAQNEGLSRMTKARSRAHAWPAWRLLLLVVIAGLGASTALAQQLLPLPSLPLQGIGRVESTIVQSDGKIIIGGSFSYVDAAGDVRVNLARFNSNGSLDTSFNFRVTSTVDALAIIGSTLYLGGDFTGISKVGGASSLRNRLAAIDLTSLTVTSWNPDADGEIFAMAASGTTLYVGGALTFIGATQRVGAASFNTSAAGALTSWDPEVFDVSTGDVFPGVVYAVAPLGSAVYFGGRFTHVNGTSTPVQRVSIAAVDPSTAVATAWNPAVTNPAPAIGTVRAIVPTASTVYIGGQFSELNGITTPLVTRLGIGAVSTTTGLATAWNPATVAGFGAVRSMALDGSTMYVGGEFTSMGTAPHNHAAGIDITTTSITSLTRVNTTVSATTTSTSGLANGNFVTLAGASPENYNGIQGPVTVVDATHFTFPIAGSPTTPATGTIFYARNNNATAFNPSLDDDVHAMAVTAPGASVVMGGLFLKANGALNPAFGGFSESTGATTIAGNVYDTASVSQLLRQPDGKTIVVGDYYATISGVLYRGLLRLNANDTLDTSWNPLVHGQAVTAALGPIVPPATAPTTVLIGGAFTGVGGTSIKRLAAVDLTSGAATSFNASPDGVINKVLVDGTTAYIGGFFQNVGGVQRNFVAAVDATSGALGSWYPAGGADGYVQTLAADASSIYVGGSFFTIGGQSRTNLAKVAKAGAAVAAWHPDPDEVVYGITPSGSSVYVSGNFAHLAGVARNFTGAVDATSGAALAFNPNPDFVVLNVTVPPTPPNTVYLSGGFLNVGGVQTGTAAAVNATSGALLPWFPLTNDTVNDLLPDATHVMLGGVFVTAGATPRFSLAAFTNAGIPDPPTNVAATAGNASATVTFSPPANTGGSAVTGYTVTSNPAGGVDANAGTTSTSHTINSLTNGVSYTFTVKASTALGTSGPSAPSKIPSRRAPAERPRRHSLALHRAERTGLQAHSTFRCRPSRPIPPPSRDSAPRRRSCSPSTRPSPPPRRRSRRGQPLPARRPSAATASSSVLPA